MEMLIQSILGFDQLAFKNENARLLEGAVFNRLGDRECRPILNSIEKGSRPPLP